MAFFLLYLEGQLSQALKRLLSCQRPLLTGTETPTFQIRLIIIRLLQESLEVVQNFLLPQVVKNFLCVVFPGQSFPGKQSNKPLRTLAAQPPSYYIPPFNKTNTADTHLHRCWQRALHPDLMVRWHRNIYTLSLE